MKERPILFSTPMVQAILEGRKTMTRRVIKPQPEYDGFWWNHPGNRPKAKKNTGAISSTCKPDYLWTNLCKYSVGDVLWVRETWHPKRHNMPTGFPYEYKATAELDGTPTNEKWKPSIFMPRKACRLFLEITNIRVERLQEITENDAISEGIIHNSINDPKIEFQWLWQFINGKESWELNPYVWVIEFNKL